MPVPLGSSDNKWLLIWEVIEYLASGTVLVGVVGEYLCDFTNVFQLRENQKRHDLSATNGIRSFADSICLSLLRTAPGVCPVTNDVDVPPLGGLLTVTDTAPDPATISRRSSSPGAVRTMSFGVISKAPSLQARMVCRSGVA